MNPEVGEELPSVQVSDAKRNQHGEAVIMPTTQAENIGAGAAELGQSTAPTQPPPMDPAGSTQDNTSATDLGPVSPSASLMFTPAIADDTDLIEKEWVDKAKEIVERTHNDPYEQNRELTRMKADYMKKRYNKDIKIEDK